MTRALTFLNASLDALRTDDGDDDAANELQHVCADIMAGLRTCMRARLHLTDARLHSALLRRLRGFATQIEALSEWGRKAVLEACEQHCAEAIGRDGWIHAAVTLVDELPKVWPQQVEPAGRAANELLERLRPSVGIHLSHAGLDEESLRLAERTRPISRSLPLRLPGTDDPATSDLSMKILREVLVFLGVEAELARRSWLSGIEKDRRKKG